MLLYPEVVLEHGTEIAQDHMHPKIMFTDKERIATLNLDSKREEFFTDTKYYNSVLNLQLLEELVNKSKSDSSLIEWAKNKGKTYNDLYVKESTSLDIMDFENFIKDRNERIVKRLTEILEM